MQWEASWSNLICTLSAQRHNNKISELFSFSVRVLVAFLVNVYLMVVYFRLNRHQNRIYCCFHRSILRNSPAVAYIVRVTHLAQITSLSIVTCFFPSLFTKIEFNVVLPSNIQKWSFCDHSFMLVAQSIVYTAYGLFVYTQSRASWSRKYCLLRLQLIVLCFNDYN